MQPTWELLGLFSAGSAALGAIATAGLINALNRRRSRDAEPEAKRQKMYVPSPVKSPDSPLAAGTAAAAAGTAAGLDAGDTGQQAHAMLNQELSFHQPAEVPEQQQQQQQPDEDAPGTPDAEASGAGPMPQNDSVVDLQKLQELEQRVRQPVTQGVIGLPACKASRRLTSVHKLFSSTQPHLPRMGMVAQAKGSGCSLMEHVVLCAPLMPETDTLQAVTNMQPCKTLLQLSTSLPPPQKNRLPI
jgi:hypothetical protein